LPRPPIGTLLPAGGVGKELAARAILACRHAAIVR
jgi:hypothetical protein